MGHRPKECHPTIYHTRRATNYIRAMAFQLISLDDIQVFKDSKKRKMIQELRKDVVIISPDKGTGIVILDISDYKTAVSNLFSNFRELQTDPTNSRLVTLQNHLNKLRNKGEISNEEYAMLRLKNAKVAQAHGTAKIHKEYSTLPPFTPIIDTIGSTHYSVGQFITKLLNPLTANEYLLKDSFEAADKIKSVYELVNEGYKFVSFDVTSLFTNVPLNKTITIILNRIYEQKLIKTTLTKRTLKKLIVDTCTKTAFSFNNKIYEQIDGVSMGASLGPVLANIIMTELEKEIVDDLLKDNIIRFYCRYVDDTLILVKPNDIQQVLNKFNSFHKNLQFTVDTFENKTPHFLNLEIHPDRISTYRKETHTGQYTNFQSYTTWNHKIAWLRSLVNRAKKICTPNKLKTEMDNKDICSIQCIP